MTYLGMCAAERCKFTCCHGRGTGNPKVGACSAKPADCLDLLHAFLRKHCASLLHALGTLAECSTSRVRAGVGRQVEHPGRGRGFPVLQRCTARCIQQHAPGAHTFQTPCTITFQTHLG